MYAATAKGTADDLSPVRTWRDAKKTGNSNISMGCRDPCKGADTLGDKARWHLRPRQASRRSICQRHGRVEVSARDRSKGQNQGDERHSSRRSVCQEGDGHVAASRSPMIPEPTTVASKSRR